MQNESSTKENETASQHTFTTHVLMALLALVIALTLFSGGFYVASAIIAAMITE